jgi:hypothetical protein
MCQPCRTVQLHSDGRWFYCPDCQRSHQHPPFDLDYYTIGYAFCPVYGSWFPIEGGDGLGIVKVDGNGQRYTMLWSKDNPRPRAEAQADGRR